MKINILDSSLRDGAQSTGISYTLEDKLAIISLLDKMGIDFIEAGNPHSNPKDMQLYEKLANIKLNHSKIVAFGSTRRKNIQAVEDANLQAILKSNTEYCCIFGKSSVSHVETILQTSLEENLNMISDSCLFLSKNDKKVIYDAEHFFDGYKQNKEYAISTLLAAQNSGAIELCLCDTNGAAMPFEVGEIVEEVIKKVSIPVSVHFHDDCGMAVANSIISVKHGATGVQGTFLGIGERCGNANLSTIIPNLQIKNNYDCINNDNLINLTATAREIASINNTDLYSNMPYVGKNAFSHKAGMHGSAVLKSSNSFEHIDPYSVGNERHFPGSEMSGKAVILEKIKSYLPNQEKNSQDVEDILSEIKRLEYLGYQFEGADASFALLVKKRRGEFTKFFDFIDYKVHIYSNENPINRATATVKISVDGNLQIMAAEGNGPVNALDSAIRKALELYYPQIRKFKLIDYKVRVLDSKSATASAVRVLITSTDGKGFFTTVGVSEDVVDASWKAIEDSIEYIFNEWKDEITV